MVDFKKFVREFVAVAEKWNETIIYGNLFKIVLIVI
jgi:hypothetical protein